MLTAAEKSSADASHFPVIIGSRWSCDQDKKLPQHFAPPTVSVTQLDTV